VLGEIKLTIACSESDRTRALMDSVIPIEGCRPTFLNLEPAEVFFRALRYEEFDVAELSLSSYLRTMENGLSPYVGIPVFLSRVFRHSSIYIRTDRGIRSPEDLRGRRVGVPEYQMTAPVWMRALLEHEYGVPSKDIHWLTGGQEEAGRTERTALDDIPGTRIEPIARGKTLSAMLAAGEIDALLAARTPSCFTRGAPNVGRMFPDYKSVELAYFKKTGMFPIMHLVGVRRSLVEDYPWLPASLYKAFCRTKDEAMKRLRQVRFQPITLPWIEPEVAEVSAVMGADYWKYGAEENRKELAAFVQYSREQGLTKRAIAIEEMFSPSTLESSKV
jgi:4,5-dihydroxyphthalate decarboxylase